MDGENFMENPIKMDDLGLNTHIFGNTHMNQLEERDQMP